LYVDHTINFLGYNWMVTTDAYKKYTPAFMQHSLSLQRQKGGLQEEGFAHFRYPQATETFIAPTHGSEVFLN